LAVSMFPDESAIPPYTPSLKALLTGQETADEVNGRPAWVEPARVFAEKVLEFPESEIRRRYATSIQHISDEIELSCLASDSALEEVLPYFRTLKAFCAVLLRHRCGFIGYTGDP